MKYIDEIAADQWEYLQTKYTCQIQQNWADKKKATSRVNVQTNLNWAVIKGWNPYIITPVSAEYYFSFDATGKIAWILPQSTKFVMAVENKTTGHSKFNDSPAQVLALLEHKTHTCTCKLKYGP